MQTEPAERRVRRRDREPVTFFGSISDAVKTLVLAVLVLALAFGWVNWTDEQYAAVLGVITAAFVLISTIANVLARDRVTPVAAPRDPDGTPLVRSIPTPPHRDGDGAAFSPTEREGRLAPRG